MFFFSNLRGQFILMHCNQAILSTWVVSFIFGNIVITAVICLVAGVFLFRRGRSKKAAIAQQATVASPQPTTASGMRSYMPEEIQEKLKRLKAGEKAEYMSIAHDLIITDQ
jgi:hypothetical protein